MGPGSYAVSLVKPRPILVSSKYIVGLITIVEDMYILSRFKVSKLVLCKLPRPRSRLGKPRPASD
jgi:hypothetical protein